MSYDFHLFTPLANTDPIAAARDGRDDEDADLNPGPLDPDAEQRKRILANALIHSNPELGIFQFGYDEIAKFEGISVEDARIKYRHLELNGADDGNGIQIILFDDTASVTVPYWHSGTHATRVFEEIWGYLQIIESHAGYAIYDPQLDRILKLSVDLNDVIDRYAGVVAKLDKQFPT